VILRSLREWQHIGYGTDNATMPVAHAERIAAVARRSCFAGADGEGVLEHGRKGLRARGVVGVIAAEGCQLEILPKIESAGEHAVSDTTLRHRLIHMLGVVHDLPVDAGSVARLGSQKDTMLDILIRLFSAKLFDAVRQGMPRRYLEHDDDLPALRGRLNVSRQFTTHAVSPQTLACRFDELSPDIALNQVMRAAVTRLQHLARAPDNQRRLRELAFAYRDVAEIRAPALRWEAITLDRTSRRWRELVSFARLFLSDRHQTTSAGLTEGHALLFEMDVLFEQYVARLLPFALAGRDVQTVSQGGHRACLFEGETGRFRSRPDLILRRSEETMMVIDTKWKRVAPRIEDPKQGVSQADVYQLMAYGRLYDCPKVMLLYPHHGALPPGQICTRYAIGSSDSPESLFIATLDMTGTFPGHVAALSGLIETSLPRRPPETIEAINRPGT
jgi:5-methylcytosine-specific restriction enzyme subunit McrC